MSYNFDEGLGDNHYNCPVVAYYPIVIDANVKSIKDALFIKDFVGIHRKKDFPKHFRKILSGYGFSFTQKQVSHAADCAYAEYERHMHDLRAKADEYLELAKNKEMPVIVLAGRPYHIDPEVNHGINRIICNLGAIVLTEDSISCKGKQVQYQRTEPVDLPFKAVCRRKICI